MENCRKKSYYYKVYGLNISSNFEISELRKNDCDNNQEFVDVTISIGEMDRTILKSIQGKKTVNYEKGFMWFNVKDVAIYKVENGNKVTISPYEGSNLEDIKIYLLGTCFGLILIEKNIVALHGGSVKIGDKGFIFIGNKGAGKTSLTSALLNKKYKFIADDVVVVEKKDKILIHPSYASQKICEDVVDILKYEKDKWDTVIIDNKKKYIVNVEEGFCTEETELGGIFLIEPNKTSNTVEVNELNGREKLEALIDNLYRIEIIQYLGMSNKYFIKFIDILKNIKIYKMQRPENKITVYEQVKVVEQISMLE